MMSAPMAMSVNDDADSHDGDDDDEGNLLPSSLRHNPSSFQRDVR